MNNNWVYTIRSTQKEQALKTLALAKQQEADKKTK